MLNFDQIHPQMPKIEKQIIAQLLEDALLFNYVVSVYDGGEWVVRNATDMQEVFRAMYSTDYEELTFYTKGEFCVEGRYIGRVILIYGNGRDIISDYSANAAMDVLLQNALEVGENS